MIDFIVFFAISGVAGLAIKAIWSSDTAAPNSTQKNFNYLTKMRLFLAK